MPVPMHAGENLAVNSKYKSLLRFHCLLFLCSMIRCLCLRHFVLNVSGELIVVNALPFYLLLSALRWFLRATAGTAIARLSHRNSVRLSVRLSVTRVNQAKTVQARIIKSSPSAAPKTLVSGSVTHFPKIP